MLPITVNDLLNAALIAAVILLVYRLTGWAFRSALMRTRFIQFDPEKAAEVRDRCFKMFPVERLVFDGATFTRGVIIRVITRQQFAIEGEFLGANAANMMCLVTGESIIAQELTAIETIQIIKQPGDGA